MSSFRVKNFGPIEDVEVDFGDLTIIVGPQANGKSLFLELFKLVQDKKHILATLKKYNYIFNKSNPAHMVEDYFGEGLAGIFKESSLAEWNEEQFSLKSLQDIVSADRSFANIAETVFYVPAQRIMSILDGRPRNFMEFDISTPYVLRIFSETLRVFVQGGLGNPDVIFPMKSRLKGAMKRSFSDSIFHKGRVIIDQSTGQRKMKLNVDGLNIPFMAWSAGQKEFMPLLLAIYCLSGPPTNIINKSNYKWVVIEEPEMGLHPKAIQSVLLEIIELMQLGYKVIISTHSTTPLEFAWAMNAIKGNPDADMHAAMSELFGIRENTTAATLFDNMSDKIVKTYYFSSKTREGGVKAYDISSLDAASENSDVADWGGLSLFSGRSADVVFKYAK